MFKKLMSALMICAITTTWMFTAYASVYNEVDIPEEPVAQVVEVNASVVETYSHDDVVKIIEDIENAPKLTQEEIELVALVTMAEAEGEPELGKRWVIDTVLNRLEDGYFGDTVHEVIYAKGQFTSMHNGRVDRCYVREDIVQLVKEELVSRTNEEVLYFRTNHYHNFGTPITQVGNHYFSTR